MKYLYHNKIITSIVLSGILFITSCEDIWNEHYDESSFDLPGYTLKEFIAQDPQLSTFAKMLEISGYDEVIGFPQSYTIWAPVNEALSNIDTTNTELVINTVKNHITRGRITTSNIEALPVRMLNGKFVLFARENDAFTFGSNAIISPDEPSSNGLIHILNGYSPYLNNLWEFLGENENLDSLREYLYGESRYIFDPLNSTEIGVNTDGQIIYDSVFTLSNPVLEELGSLDNEDSIYTSIMPDNNAWSEAYNRIERYFNFPDDGGGMNRKRAKTQFTLIQDMLFRGRIEDPESLNTLVSTGGNIYNNPGQLFTDVYETSDLSNGIANITSLMPFTDTDSWFKEIRIEAEDTDGRSNSNNVIYSRTSYGSGLNISGDKYILVDPTAAESSVEFSIPNTLSAKYNIYCVFVPGSIADATDFTPTKVKYVLTYIRRSSGSTFIKSITPFINITFPIGLTKMYVDQFDFEYANVIDEEYDKVSVKLEVINDVSSAEEQAGDYSRTMRIDCIILEPVIE